MFKERCRIKVSAEIEDKREELAHDDGQKKQEKEEEEGETSSQNLKGRKDHNHVLMVGEIRVSLGKDPGGKANEDVSCKEAERQPTKPVISEDMRRREEEHSEEMLMDCSQGEEQKITAELESAAEEREDKTWILLIYARSLNLWRRG
jgi:hypothetical protein